MKPLFWAELSLLFTLCKGAVEPEDEVGELPICAVSTGNEIRDGVN